MPLVMITPPMAQPLHLNAVKRHLRVDLPDDDDLIDIYLSEAVNGAFIETQRQLVAAKFQYVLDEFPECAIELPVAPLLEVSSIQYTALDGSTKTVSPSTYVINEPGDRGLVVPLFGNVWPISQPQSGSVLVNFSAGYVSPFVADLNTDTIKVTNWPALVIGAVVRVSNSGGTLPKPLQPKTDYYIQSVVSPGVCKLAATPGGAAIDLTDNGAGLNFMAALGINENQGEIPGAILSWLLLTVETRYSYRGGLINTPGGMVTKNPFIDRILDPYRLVLQ